MKFISIQYPKLLFMINASSGKTKAKLCYQGIIIIFCIPSELLFCFFTVDKLCYKDWNYLESSRRSMSRNVLFHEFSRTVTHLFQNSL